MQPLAMGTELDSTPQDCCQDGTSPSTRRPNLEERVNVKLDQHSECLCELHWKLTKSILSILTREPQWMIACTHRMHVVLFSTIHVDSI